LTWQNYRVIVLPAKLKKRSKLFYGNKPVC